MGKLIRNRKLDSIAQKNYPVANNKMISTLILQQFRGLEYVKFENLGRVNLIVGGNNVGKTSILESLILLYGSRYQLNNFPRMFREFPSSENNLTNSFWKLLVRNQEQHDLCVTTDDKTISGGRTSKGWHFFDTGKIGRGGSGTETKMVAFGQTDFVRQETKSDISVCTTKQSEPVVISELFNQIAPLNPDNEAKIEELLRNSVEPRLRRLRYARPEGNSTHLVYVDLGEGKMLPFTQMGQAFARTLQVYCEIFAQRPKILLIDEIENGLYYEGMEDYWKGLMAVLEDQDVQLFATTHSRECMEAAYRAAKGMPNDPLRYLRLDRRIDDPAKIVATTFGKEEMATAIEFNREMR